MSQKFISLDDASSRLGVSKDRLNQLREGGDLRAYRDGASWKFRTEDIEKLEAEGVPADDTVDDDYSMATGSDLSLAGIDDGPPTPNPGDDAADDDTLKASGDDGGEDGDDDIGLGVEPLGDGDDAESILLTGDQDLEGGIPRPQSTIIGKSELSLEDDLELAASSDVTPSQAPAKPAEGGSFDGIEELELDLDAESSLKLDAGSGDATPAKPAPKAEESGELELEELDLDLVGSSIGSSDDEGSSGSDILGGGEKSGADLGSVTGLSGLDEVDLAADEDDDLVLGGSDDSGSGDLAAGDSGINLSPSESGFALDEVPLDLGGSALGSQLDLASLSAGGSSPASGPAISGLGGEDFQLTPADSTEDDDDSSQIVALDDVSEEEDDVGFDEEDDEVDFEGGFDGGLEAQPVAAPVGAVSAQEIPFPGWIIGLLGAGFFSMMLCGLMVMDLMQSMWAWDEPFAFNSSVIEGLLGILGQ